VADRVFRDRRNAGRVLAGLLDGYRDRLGVLALPRGGVPVGYEVATALGAPLDVFLVRKLGVPGREELAMGAIASGGIIVANDDVIRGLDITPEVVARVAVPEGRELASREAAYREGRPPGHRTAEPLLSRRVAEQFDAIVHIDEIPAVEPLERTAGWERGEAPETYPFTV
jgi:predicted phosphoribosyltransferase